MSDSQNLSIPANDVVPQPAVWMAKLGSLLQDLGDGAAAPPVASPAVSPQIDNQLVQVRLGIASSLYVALRAKHAATASHSLRVAMTGSAWAMAMELPGPQRDALEVAALLHDVGVIGLPDKILLKPGPLDDDELRIVENSRRNLGMEILRVACAEPAILQIVENVGAWYDGFRGGFSFTGTEIPLGARMISIAEAYDAMTNDRVFRAAVSQERAMAELFHSAGSQFDPELARSFAELMACDQSELRLAIAQCWLQRLDPEAANSCWEWSPPPAASPAGQGESLFQMRLLDNMHDAVIFVDAHLKVLRWNHGAERLTGIAGSSMGQRPWSPGLLNLHNEKGEPIAEDDCPVHGAIRSGVQSLRRLSICGRNGRSIPVDTHTLAVVGDDGTTFGAVLLLHDASSEISLEERCQSLHEKATKDPLTQVANRAEADCVHEAFIRNHRQHHLPCSLLICDLDKFKQVNDTYGHQAGDDVIKSLATLLKNSCRPGDLVARYGGEEFVMLCADCDNAGIARRAEQIRKGLSQHLPTATGRPLDHRQLRSHRDPAGRHGRDDAPPGRPRVAHGQSQGPQHGGATGRRARRPVRAKRDPFRPAAGTVVLRRAADVHARADPVGRGKAPRVRGRPPRPHREYRRRQRQAAHRARRPALAPSQRPDDDLPGRGFPGRGTVGLVAPLGRLAHADLREDHAAEAARPPPGGRQPAGGRSPGQFPLLPDGHLRVGAQRRRVHRPYPPLLPLAFPAAIVGWALARQHDFPVLPRPPCILRAEP